jgi:hypothetical protein
LFISPILRDHYYIARQSKRRVRYVWTRVPLMPGLETRVEADDVPEWKIREVRMTCLSVTALGK